MFLNLWRWFNGRIETNFELILERIDEFTMEPITFNVIITINDESKQKFSKQFCKIL